MDLTKWSHDKKIWFFDIIDKGNKCSMSCFFTQKNEIIVMKSLEHWIGFLVILRKV